MSEAANKFIQEVNKDLEDKNHALLRPEIAELVKTTQNQLWVLRGEVADNLTMENGSGCPPKKISEIIMDPKLINAYCTDHPENRARIGLFLVGKGFMEPSELWKTEFNLLGLREPIRKYQDYRASENNQWKEAKNGEIAYLMAHYPFFIPLILAAKNNPEAMEKLRMRMDLYHALDEVKEGLGGAIKRQFNSHTIKVAIPAAQRWLLSPNLDMSANIQTYFEKWDGIMDPDNNTRTLRTTSMVEFVTTLTNKTETSMMLLGKLSYAKIEDPKKAATRDRMLKFIGALESRYPDVEKSEIRKIYTYLSKNDIDNAQDQIQMLCRGKFKNEIWDFSSNTSLGRALRAIKNTDAAEEVLATGSVDKDVDSNKPFVNFLREKFPSKQQEVTAAANLKVNAILESLRKSGDPRFVQQSEAKKEFTEATIRTLATIEIAKEFIKANPDAKLPEALHILNDMRGISGFFNLSDEGVEIARDVAIMAAGFIITMGTSTLLEAAVAGVRAAQLGRLAAAASNAEKWSANASKLQRAFGAVNRGMATAAEATGTGLARTANAYQWVSRHSAIKIAADALTFSVVDTAGHDIWTCQGDPQESFASFAEKTVKNAGMFALFHGAGKSMELLKNLGPVNKFLAKWGMPAKIMSGAMDITGDVAAMYVLNSIQSGDLTVSDEDLIKIVEQCVAFRGVASSFGTVFPKIESRMKEKSAEYRKQVELVKDGFIPSEDGKALVNKKDGIKYENGKLQSTREKNLATLERNAQLSDGERLTEAGRLLRRPLSDADKDALIKAHKIKHGQNIPKGRTLREEWEFSRDEVRILMDKGIAGDMGTSQSPASSKTKVVKDVISREAFKNSSTQVDGNPVILLDELGLSGVSVKKYKNPWRGKKQYEINGLNPNDNNLYSLPEIKQKIEDLVSKGDNAHHTPSESSNNKKHSILTKEGLQYFKDNWDNTSVWSPEQTQEIKREIFARLDPAQRRVLGVSSSEELVVYRYAPAIGSETVLILKKWAETISNNPLELQGTGKITLYDPDGVIPGLQAPKGATIWRFYRTTDLAWMRSKFGVTLPDAIAQSVKSFGLKIENNAISGFEWTPQGHEWLRYTGNSKYFSIARLTDSVLELHEVGEDGVAGRAIFTKDPDGRITVVFDRGDSALVGPSEIISKNTHSDTAIAHESTLSVPKKDQLRHFIQRAGLWENEVLALDKVGLPGWSVKKLPQGNAPGNNVYELSIPEREPIKIKGQKKLIKKIQEEARASRAAWEEVPTTPPAATPTAPQAAPNKPAESINETKTVSIETAKPGDILVRDYKGSTQSFRKEKDGTWSLLKPDGKNVHETRISEKDLAARMANTKPVDAPASTEVQVIPIGTNWERLVIDGVEHRWSDKQGWWVGRNPNGSHRIVYPTAGKGAIALPGIKPEEIKPGEIIPESRRIEFKKQIDGIDPELTKGIDAVVKDPSKTPKLLEHLWKHWGKYIAAGIALAILVYIFSRQKQEHPEITTLPPPTPADAANPVAADGYARAACRLYNDALKSDINLNRPSAPGSVILTQKRRENISARWVDSPAWTALLKEIDTNKYPETCDELIQKILDAKKSPDGRTIKKIQDIQRLVSLWATDDKDNQDGILGPITTQAIRAFLKNNLASTQK